MTHSAALFLLLISASLTVASQARADDKNGDTIESLQGKQVEIRPGKVIVHSTDLARDNYRAFLELAVDDPDQRAEAMRRLGDLELDATEAAQLVENIDDMNESGYNSAVQMYEQLLEEFPNYRRNDTVMYQLGRAYEMVGRTDESLAVLNKLVVQYPDTPLIDEAQFRRGEMLFLRKQYNEAEMAYSGVVAFGPSSRFYEQSLYKLGWSQFKLAWYEQSLDPFFELLDRKISDMQWQGGEYRLEEMTRADQELVEDTFRVLSIGFSSRVRRVSIAILMVAAALSSATLSIAISVTCIWRRSVLSMLRRLMKHLLRRTPIIPSLRCYKSRLSRRTSSVVSQRWCWKRRKTTSIVMAWKASTGRKTQEKRIRPLTSTSRRI
jgi:tetratricopeptide (TPR) repeat protein